MELKSREQLEIGDVLARPIYNSKGVALLSAGAVLTEKNIEKLNSEFTKLEGQYFYTETPGSESIIIEDKISEQVRSETAKAVRNRQIEKLINQAKVISKQVVDYDIHEVDYYDTRNASDYISRHSVNVAIISCIIGRSMGFNEKELEEVTLAGLLHDFAKTNDNDSQIRKIYEERLNCKKDEILPYITYDLLKDTDYAKNDKISSRVLGSILCHHEHQNGTGYYKMNSEMINKHKYASILHVADIYDTLANNDTKSIITDLPSNTLYLFVKNGGLTPKNIVAYFMSDCAAADSQKLFDTKVVNHFIKYVSIYTKGRRVVLSNNDIAIVNRNFIGHSDRPEVVVIDGEFKGKTINLSSDMDSLNLIVKDYAYDIEESKSVIKK